MASIEPTQRSADLEAHIEVLRSLLLQHGIIPPALVETPVSRPGSPGDGGLSSRELDVVALVAEGLPNAEVAKRLFVGVDTVKTHLQRAYRKLDVHSRAGAAVWYVTTYGAPTTEPVPEARTASR